MTTLRIKQLLWVSSLAGILIAVGGRSAQAESLQSSAQLNQTRSNPISATAQAAGTNSSLTAQTTSSDNASPAASPAVNAPTPVTDAETVQPPISAETSATRLQAAPETAQTPAPQNTVTPNTVSNSDSLNLAQGVDPGRATRSGSSYIGLGGNIGFGGDTGLGTSNFAVISKVGLTRNLSLRPTALVGDGATFLVPATVDFPIEATVGRVGLAPYIGGGVAISTGDDSEVQPLVTAGVDVPISSQFTANASANVSFPDDVEVGVILGIGYNFR